MHQGFFKMHSFWFFVLIGSSLFVWAVMCDGDISEDGERSANASQSAELDNEIPVRKKSPTDVLSGKRGSANVPAFSSRTISSPNGVIDLSVPMFAVQYGSFQIQAFNTTNPVSDASAIYYAPAATLLPDAAAVSLNAEADKNCLFISLKLWDKPYHDAVRNYVSYYINSNPIITSAIFPLPFKWMLVGYSNNGFTRTMKNTAWQSIANMPPSISMCIRCSTSAACNDALATLQYDSAKFASRVFVSFKSEEPVSRRVPLCIDPQHLPRNAFISALSKNASGRNYMFMKTSDYANFTKTLLAAAVEKMVDEGEFVDDDEIDRLASEMSAFFPYNVTTIRNLTPEMWAATYWKNERPDIKARRLDSILGSYRPWVRQQVDSGYIGYETTLVSDPVPYSAEVIHAYHEMMNSMEMFWNDNNQLVLDKLPIYRVNLDVFRQKAPVCKGSVHISSSTADYTVPANVGGGVSDDKTQFVTKKEDVKGMTVSQATVQWQCRDASSLYALSNQSITVTLLDANDDPFSQVTVTTTTFTGEFALMLPRTSDYSIVFEINQYRTVTLRNFSDNFGLPGDVVFMEPLLFIPTSLGKGSGRTGGTVHLVSGNHTVTKAGIQVELREGRYNLTGPVAATAFTAENGTWLAELPSGHFTATISTPDADYTAPPFSAVVVPGTDTWHDMAMAQPLDNGEIRIILRATGFDLYDLKLLVSGPLENRDGRAIVQASANVSADGLIMYDNVDTMFGSVLIKKQLPGAYRIQVYENNYRPYKADSNWNLCNSQSWVQIYRGKRLWAQYYVPIKDGNVWIVAEISDFRLNVINDVKYDT
ncbi:uncharacterized protein LOC129582603 [Paramacrobiotus metropolitanus]|uniref:uncharacterized protein LOC129582603 n=1 Tax=Paramacrobiotus metropolitanus TaxID=2943436 RepID=UPI0024464598|nr:uncharacterized protein LOC129582603 [Paramacrobiotus metropolitanus]